MVDEERELTDEETMERYQQMVQVGHFLFHKRVEQIRSLNVLIQMLHEIAEAELTNVGDHDDDTWKGALRLGRQIMRDLGREDRELRGFRN